jgi:hypothetical protein
MFYVIISILIVGLAVKYLTRNKCKCPKNIKVK